MMVDIKAYRNDFENKWCPGCGNFGILQALKQALAAQNIPPEDVLIVSGIGQAAKTPFFLRCNGFNGLHGRALPVATAAKIANHNLKIVLTMGDGDCYAEGGNHFLHAVRRNIDLTLLVHNNRVYGLTKGQASPTAEEGFVTRAQPFGVIAHALNSLAVALVLGAGFVARGYAGETNHLSELIQKGMSHRGFSLIDILQPCVSFNHVNTREWYNERVYFLEGDDYRTTDRMVALVKTQEWGEKIPLGVFFQDQDGAPSFTDQLPPLKKGTLLEQRYDAEKILKIVNSLGG